VINIKKFNYKYDSLFLVIFIITLIALAGCTESKTSSSSVVQSDDGIEPNNPSWNEEVPFVVQKLIEQSYQVTLHWNKVTTNKCGQAKNNISGYYIYRRLEDGVNQKVATTAEDYYVDKSGELTEGKKIFYTIVAFDNQFRESLPSAPQLIKMQLITEPAPKAPSNINFALARQSVTGLSSGSIIVSWDPPTQKTDGTPLLDLKEFEIERRDGKTNEWQPAAKISAGFNVFSDSNLVTGVYYYRIRAVDSQGYFSQYAEGSFTPENKIDGISPGTPSQLVASGEKPVQLTWTNPNSNANLKTLDLAGFKIYRKIFGEGEIYQLVKVMPVETLWIDTSVDMYTKYQYTVSSFDKFGNESKMSRPAANRMGVEFPETPGNIYVKMQSLGSVKLSWDAVAGAISYKIYRSELSDGGYAMIGKTAATVYTNSILDEKTYYYKVSAINSQGLEGSPTDYAAISGNVASRSFEAKNYFQNIKPELSTAIASPATYKLEVRSFQYPFNLNPFLFFSPINDLSNETVAGGTAVGDWFEIRQRVVADLTTNPTYDIDIWALCTEDSGMYRIVVNGEVKKDSYDFFLGSKELVPINIKGSLGGSYLQIGFICMSKNASSKNYNLYLDKIVIK